MKTDTLNLLDITPQQYEATLVKNPFLFGTTKKDKNNLVYLNKDIFYLKSL
jgi:hypothetical protein